MLLSKKFLNDYVDVNDLTTKDIAEGMTLVGNEYDSIEKLSNATKIIVGKTLSVIDHPDSDHLHVCQVDIGNGEVTQIVCGAPNVAADQHVLIALPGAILPGGEIKAGVIRGEESNGMICALDELGVDNKYIHDEEERGIYVIDGDVETGIDALEYLGLDDEAIDFDLTPNRGDLLSVIGMAYEVGATFDKEVNEPVVSIKEETGNVDDYVSVFVETDKCPLYLARVVKDVVIKESPTFIKSRLMASGIRPINNVVDISNYVMLEYGQPLHFFDYKNLGKKIIVRMAKEKEKMTTLDNNLRELSTDDIVISNEKEAVALAGVMGGLNSEVESDTKDIVIESAIFNSINVRKTSNKILRSEASNRFEKGIDYNNTYKAIDRACQLLEKYASAKVIKGTVKYDNIFHNEKVITITQDKISEVLGLDLSTEDILSAFKKLSFDVSENSGIFTVKAPTRRLDINIEEDLIEEVGRIHGINHIESRLPKTLCVPGSYDPSYLKIKKLRQRLCSLGLTEVKNYTLTNEENVNTFSNDVVNPIKLLLPMREDRTTLRTTLIPSLIENADYNIARKTTDIAIYESSNTYYYDEDENVVEHRLLSGLLTGVYLQNNWNKTKVICDFYLAKGIVENILDFMGLTGRYSFDDKDIPQEFHPKQTARIVIDRIPIGYVGVVHPKVNKKKLYIFELDLDELLNIKVRNIKNKEINKYPSISKDMGFILDKDIKAGDVLLTIKKTGGKILKSVDVFDVYTGENVDADKKSVAFSLVFEDNNKTLNDEEVMVIFNKIIEKVEKEYSAKLRDK